MAVKHTEDGVHHGECVHYILIY